MNFFEAQDAARRKTKQLSLMFAAAVVTLIVLTNVLVAIVYGWTGLQTGLTFAQTFSQIPLDTWVWISSGVIGIVAVASFYKYLTIQGGGRAVAESLGGSLVHPNTTNHHERQLLNVIEEMAIASGITVPPVYLIPERSINAFAAGFTIDDAVIGINQGTLDNLNRDELQGVIAHEFSHILNGDTNINLRLIAILHGILFIGMIGYGFLRAGAFSRRNGLPIIALGAGLLAVGFGGTFFGNMIKASVSRQREYLADASAVQFTRNSSGIADALKKIGGLTEGSTIINKNAEEASHMFFGSVANKFGGLFSTHPPLEKRIRAIEPNWQGGYESTPSTTSSVSSTESALAGISRFNTSTTPDALVEQVGHPDENSLQIARQLIADNDSQLHDAAHDSYEARALIYAMLIDPNDGIANHQLAYLEANAESGVPSHVNRLLPLLSQTDSIHQLTLIELAIPALKALSKQQYSRFSHNTAQLITSDGHVDVFEWVIHRLLIKDLYSHFEGPIRTHGRIANIGKVSSHGAKLLAILASQSHVNFDAQLAAYNAGKVELGIDEAFTKQDIFNYEHMNEALGKLRELRPLVKPALIKACATTVMHDGELKATEFALMQGIAATLDCPLPQSIYKS